MFNWVIYRPPKVLKFQSLAKLEQIIVIVTTRSVSCYFKNGLSENSILRNSSLSNKLQISGNLDHRLKFLL